MKAQVVKLSIYENEDIMLIAPDEILYNFLTSLSCMIFDAALLNDKEGYHNTANSLREFRKQVLKERNEIQSESLER